MRLLCVWARRRLIRSGFVGDAFDYDLLGVRVGCLLFASFTTGVTVDNEQHLLCHHDNEVLFERRSRNMHS